MQRGCGAPFVWSDGQPNSALPYVADLRGAADYAAEAEGGGGERVHAPWAQGGGKGGRGGVGNPFAKSFADARKGAEKEGGGKKQKFGWQAMG